MKYYINRTNPTLNGIDSLFNDIFGDNYYNARVPKVDVYETPESYVIEAEVAGYNEKDIAVSVEKHVLSISSTSELKKANDEEKKEEKKEEKNYLIREISRPSFTRSFTLPEDVDEEKIIGETKDGILMITLPKTHASQRGRIEVKIN